MGGEEEFLDSWSREHEVSDEADSRTDLSPQIRHLMMTAPGTFRELAEYVTQHCLLIAALEMCATPDKQES